MDRIPKTQSISWFVDIRKMEKLDLNPEYQRRSVWSLKYRLFFVDTIIHNYPSPTIFLMKDYDANNHVVYKVVDGKQRLTTIFKFLDGEFCTPINENEPSISEKYFLELPKEIQRRFLDYQIMSEEMGNATSSEINEAFDRLNRNVAKLNAQELRHARYSGRFIHFCETWAKNPWFQNSAICTQSRSDRMSDIEFVSELIILTEKGIFNGKEILDDVYADYDDEIPNETRLYEDFERILDVVKKLNLSATSKAPFGNIGDIYSLWAAIREVHLKGETVQIQASREALVKLSTEIESRSTEAGKAYSKHAQSNTNSLSSRQKRANVIRAKLVVAS
jgi:hypothetical protein